MNTFITGLGTYLPAKSPHISLLGESWVQPLSFNSAAAASLSPGSATNGPFLKVSVSKVSGTTVSGPITESWTVAQGSLRGTIYYETYDSTILGGGGSDAGGLGAILGSVLAEATGIGIMKIQPGATQPTPLKSGCGNVCHAASADGSTLVAATTIASSSSYDLKTNASAPGTSVEIAPAAQRSDSTCVSPPAIDDFVASPSTTRSM